MEMTLFTSFVRRVYCTVVDDPELATDERIILVNDVCRHCKLWQSFIVGK